LGYVVHRGSTGGAAGSKLEKARTLGIEVISEDDFVKLLA